jgi:lipopolysaccharide transport system permease protein
MTNLTATVYTAESPLRHPGPFVRAMFRDLMASRELAWRLFVRDTSAQYRQSMLGYVWAFLPPLVASLPFVFLNAQGVVKLGATPIPYAAYAMIGTIIWQVFVDALNSPLKTVTASKSMLARINFPREAILLSGVAQILLNFLIRLVLLVGVFIWFKITPPSSAILFPLGVFALISVGFMLGLALTPLGILYGDVAQSLPILTTCFMFLTPVLYPLPAGGLAAQVARWNPLTPLVAASRDWLTVGATTHLGAFVAVTLFTQVFLLAGWIGYRLALPHIISRIGN